MQKLSITTIIVMLFLIPLLSYAGERRTNVFDHDGNWIPLLDIGDCNPSGCVITEKYTETWDHLQIIHQFYDTNDDGFCDIISIFQPLKDPEFGEFWRYSTTKECGSAI